MTDTTQAAGLTDEQIDKMLHDLDDRALAHGDNLPGLTLNSSELPVYRSIVRAAVAAQAVPAAGLTDEQVIQFATQVLMQGGSRLDVPRRLADFRLAASPAPAEAKEEPRNTATHRHLSALIGLWLGARQRGDFKYAEGSAVDKAVKEAIEHLKDWPYSEAAPALTEEQEREAFEAWYASIWLKRTGKTQTVAELSAVVTSMREGDGYTDGAGGDVPYLNNLWEGWQARAALRSPQGGE